MTSELVPQTQSTVAKCETWKESIGSVTEELQHIFKIISGFIDFKNAPENNKPQNYLKEEMNFAIESQKEKLKLKSEQILKLKSDIRDACVLATSVISSKQSEIESLKQELHNTQTQITKLKEEVNSNVEMIKRLSVENQVLGDKLENLNNFISLGYRELQKINGDTDKEFPVTMELRKIIVSCGKYYACYCEEKQKRSQCDHKIEQLSNQIKLLENMIKNNMTEIDEALRKNSKLYNENKFLKEKFKIKKLNSDAKKIQKITENSKTVVEPLSGVQNEITFMKDEIANLKVKLTRLPKQIKKPQNANSKDDLKESVSVVNSLLIDQDKMLQELKDISRELVSDTKILSNFTKSSLASTTSFENVVPNSLPKGIHVECSPSDFVSENVVKIDKTELYPSFYPTNRNDKTSNKRKNGQLQKTSTNTMVLYVTTENLDEKSTLYGITSDMKQVIDGSVASKVKKFEDNNYKLGNGGRTKLKTPA